MLDKNINVIRIKSIGKVISQQPNLTRYADNVLSNALKDKIAKMYLQKHSRTGDELLNKYRFMYNNLTSYSHKPRTYDNIKGVADISFNQI